MHPCKASAGPDLCRACEKDAGVLWPHVAQHGLLAQALTPLQVLCRKTLATWRREPDPALISSGLQDLQALLHALLSVYPSAPSVCSSVGFHRLLPLLKGLRDLLGLLQAPHRCPPLLKGLQDWLALLQAPLPRRPARRWSSWSSRRSRTSRLQDLLALLQTSPPGLAGPLRPLARPFCRPTDLLGTAGCCSALCAKASLRTSCSAPLKQARRSQASPGRS